MYHAHHTRENDNHDWGHLRDLREGICEVENEQIERNDVHNHV